MPIYEYECTSCGGRFEVVRKFSDPELSVCALCNAASVRKVLSPTAFVLKGSGWYATDYAAQGKKSECPAEASSSKSQPAAGCSSGACAGACSSKG